MKLTKALLINYEYCSGCHSCEIACRNHLGIGLGKWQRSSPLSSMTQSDGLSGSTSPYRRGFAICVLIALQKVKNLLAFIIVRRFV